MIARFFREEREVYVLGLLRVAFATLLFFFTLKMARELWLLPYFGDVFHLPLWPEGFVPSRFVYGALLVFQGACSLLALGGLWSRPALFAGAGCGLFCFFCDRLQYHNNRYELLLLTLLVSLTPCDRSFLPFGAARPGAGPRWAARFVGLQISVVYLASSLGKLFDADWRGGAVLLIRFDLGRQLSERFLPASVAALLAQPWFAHAAALSAIGSELFLALGPWCRRTRALALWLGVMFHIGIELSAHVELFSYTMLCGYLVFVTPELRERRLSWNIAEPRGQRLSILFRRLDLLARFRHESPSAQSALLEVSDREGHVHRGLPAWRELARATPVLFPLWLPLALVTWLRRAR